MSLFSTPAPGQAADTVLSATAPQQRLLTLDGLRGIALLGIFLMNIESMAGGIWDGLTGVDGRWEGADKWADGLIYFFLQGKFYTLFSLLFGAGFMLMLQRADAAGKPFVPMFLRRLLVLFCIGAVHAVLIWEGDILMSYALVGGGLFLMRSLSARWLWTVGLGLWVMFPALCLGLAAMMALAGDVGLDMANAVDTQMQNMREQGLVVYATGNFWQVTLLRMQNTAVYFANLPMLAPLLLGIFCIGAAMMRQGVFTQPAHCQRLLHLLLWLGLLSGGLLMGASMLVSPKIGNLLRPEQAAAQALLMLAQLPMALAYLAAIVLIGQTALGQGVLRVFAPAGRMALSNYLLQSLIISLLFYGYGLGLFGQFTRIEQVVFVLLVFAAQLLLSAVWLRFFRYGPMEWLWRWGTYLHRPALRVQTV